MSLEISMACVFFGASKRFSDIWIDFGLRWMLLLAHERSLLYPRSVWRNHSQCNNIKLYHLYFYLNCCSFRYISLFSQFDPAFELFLDSFCSKNTFELKVQHFFYLLDQIQTTPNGIVQLSVGDHSLVSFKLNEIRIKERIHKTIFPSHTSKKPNQCASTMTFLA